MKFMSMKFLRNVRGSGLIETVVGLAIIFVSIFFLIKTYNYYLKFALSHKNDVEASLLLEEGVEAIRFIRDRGWSSYISPLSVATPYSLYFDGSVWMSTTTNKYVDETFSRTFIINDVYRGSNDQIAQSGTLDPGTMKATVSVSYPTILGTTTKSMSFYIANLFND